MYTALQIQQITAGKFLLKKNEDAVIEHLLIDSRKLLFPSATLFFAIAGPRRQGVAYVKELYQKGVNNFIVDENFSATATTYPNANFIGVPNVLLALQQLTAYHRKQFSFPVIGITGSNGKTIVKEWLYQLLQSDYNIVRSPKSYNSQIGVPLSIWQMNSQHNLGIFEAGISMNGEMERLEKIIAPTIGVFTNIGDAHSEGFENIKQKAAQKALLFAQAQTVVYCKDDAVVEEALQQSKAALFSWGQTEAATLYITTIQVQAFNTVIKAQYKDNKVSISIPFTNDAAIKNAITCWCVLLHLGLAAEVISERMLQLKPVEMRLELKEGINHCSVINDSYSADLTSLSMALDFLQQQQQHAKRTVIISDILQSGKAGMQLYTEMADILQQKNISRFIGIGTEISKYQDCFNQLADTTFFNSTADFVRLFPTLHFYNETILLKGARVFEFEQISHLLEQKTHQTVLEINLDAITHNLKAYQQLLNPGVKLMAMVKAFSYGSGSFEIANLLQFHKVDYLAVAYADEGVELRRAGIRLPIMVMNPDGGDFDRMLQYQLEPEIYSLHILQQLIQKAGNQTVSIHIKLETGMNRLGFVENELEELISLLQLHKNIVVKTTFSHLAASEDKTLDSFTIEQINTFEKLSSILISTLNYPIKKHILNSSGILRFPQAHYDFVRLGIGLYGVDSANQIQKELLPIGKLKTRIAQIKIVPQGQTVGYSRKGKADKDLKIAILAIGYADGYDRRMGNGMGEVFIAGQRAHIIGNICMDMCMANADMSPVCKMCADACQACMDACMAVKDAMAAA